MTIKVDPCSLRTFFFAVDFRSFLAIDNLWMHIVKHKYRVSLRQCSFCFLLLPLPDWRIRAISFGPVILVGILIELCKVFV